MWIYPRVLAHRGGGKLAPENTLAALRTGLEHGFAAVEFDVMLSFDQVPLLMHDPVLGRTLLGEGLIAELSAAQLQRMDAGAWFEPRFAGEKVPLLSEVLHFCLQHKIWMNIEIKPSPGWERITGQVAAKAVADFYQALPQALPPAQMPLFSSFSMAAMEAVQQTAPQIARALLFDRIPLNWRQQMEKYQACALHTNHLHLTPDMAAQIKAAGYGLFCYTVNDVERARYLLSIGVDAFCTDRIDLIGADFAERNLASINVNQCE